MEQASITDAVERIEAALARIEAASRDMADLRERHRHLKASVSRSLGDLDRLLESPAE